MAKQTSELSEKARAALPRHIAVIMDGNGRWAKARKLPRVEGHRRGADSVREIVTVCGELGIEFLTLYAFSVENWTRPKNEVDTLMKYLSHYLHKELDHLNKNNVRLRIIGQQWRLPESVQSDLTMAVEKLSSNTGLTLVLALSYGSRQEITEAVRQIAREVAAGDLTPDLIDEATISGRLFTVGIPDPELLIRTSGEVRVSNFLLWQISYTEFVVSSTHWPDFRRPHILEALEEYALRNRRFGGI